MIRKNGSKETPCIFGLSKPCPFGFTPDQLLGNEKLLKYCSFCMKAAYANRQVKQSELKLSVVNTL